MSRFWTESNSFVLDKRNLFANLPVLAQDFRPAQTLCSSLVIAVERMTIVLGCPQSDRTSSLVAPVNQSPLARQQNVSVVKTAPYNPGLNFSIQSLPAFVSDKMGLFTVVSGYTSRSSFCYFARAPA